jgi:hypothetical protein
LKNGEQDIGALATVFQRQFREMPPEVSAEKSPLPNSFVSAKYSDGIDNNVDGDHGQTDFLCKSSAPCGDTQQNILQTCSYEDQCCFTFSKIGV